MLAHKLSSIHSASLCCIPAIRRTHETPYTGSRSVFSQGGPCLQCCCSLTDPELLATPLLRPCLCKHICTQCADSAQFPSPRTSFRGILSRPAVSDPSSPSTLIRVRIPSHPGAIRHRPGRIARACIHGWMGCGPRQPSSPASRVPRHLSPPQFPARCTTRRPPPPLEQSRSWRYRGHVPQCTLPRKGGLLAWDMG